jgi:tetratricopeptide (TPR) repeat protein
MVYDMIKMRIVTLLEQQRCEEADAELRRLAAMTPQDGPLHALRALCLLEMEEWQDALAVARNATTLAPETAYCHWALAMVRIRCHEFRKARVAAAKAVRLDASTPDYVYALARAEAGQGNWAEALAALDQALELQPDHRAVASLRALVLEKRDGAAQLSGEFLADLKQEPEDAIARAARGWLVLHEQTLAGVSSVPAVKSSPRPLSVAGMFGALVSRWLSRWLGAVVPARRKAA